MGIMEVTKWQESGSKKSRFQVLAARFPSSMNPNDTRAAREEMTKAGMGRDDIDRMFKRCDGWYRPHNWSQRFWIHELIRTGK